MYRVLIVLVCLLACAGLAQAQCGPGGCSGGSRTLSVERPACPCPNGCSCDGTQGGSCSCSPAVIEVSLPAGSRIWIDGDETRSTGSLRTFTSPPLDKGQTYTYNLRVLYPNGLEDEQEVEVTAGQTSRASFDQEAGQALFGVELGKIKPGKVTINGKPVTRAEALDAAAEGLPEDKAKTRLTVIGSEAERAAVLKDLDSDPSLAPMRDKLVIQSYGPDEWPVKCGFKVDGHPSLYLQQPNGKVLHRQDDYQDGPKGLVAALRKIDPAYNPAADPDLRKSVSLPSIPAGALAGIAGFLLLLTRKG